MDRIICSDHDGKKRRERRRDLCPLVTEDLREGNRNYKGRRGTLRMGGKQKRTRETGEIRDYRGVLRENP